MNLGFFVMRLSFLKHFAPLVERALAEGLDVTLFCDQSGRQTPRRGPKSYEFPRVDALPAFRAGTPRVRVFATAAELARQVDELGIAAMTTAVGFELNAMLREMRPARTPLLAQLQHVPNANVLRAVTDFDVVYGLSPEWTRWAADYQVADGVVAAEARERYLKDLGAVYVAAGLVEADQLRTIDPEAVRARLRLPRGRRVLLYLPFPFESVRSHGDFWPNRIYRHRRWRQYLYLAGASVAGRGRPEFLPYARHGWNDRALVAAVRRFCDRNGAVLLVKARAKNPVPRYLARAADGVLYDEAYYPATILELLSVADLCVHFYSAAVGEAAYAAVPSVCVAPSAREWPAYARRAAVPEFSTVPDAFYHWGGLVYSRDVPAMITGFDRAGFDDFALDRGRRTAFLERFFGPDDLEASRRVVADLRRRLAA